MSPQANPIMNLDIRCAELGQKLSEINKIDEKMLNDALAVLEEQGVYAMFLYIKARHEDIYNSRREDVPGLEKRCREFLQKVFRDKLSNCGDVLEAAKQLADNLDDLLFARDLLRNALSYARYHLKARGD